MAESNTGTQDNITPYKYIYIFSSQEIVLLLGKRGKKKERESDRERVRRGACVANIDLLLASAVRWLKLYI